MKNLLETADEIPVTLLIALAYVTMAFLTDPFDPSYGQLRDHGMLVPMLSVESGSWRLIAATFLHGGILHLLMNMMGLLSFGPSLERALGSARFAVLYLLAGLGGSLACTLWYAPQQPVVGGSGALFGLVGGTLAWQVKAGRHALSFLEFEGPRRLLLWIAFAFVFGLLVPVISNTGHAGGLVTGFAIALLYLVPGRTRSTPWLHAWRIAFAAMLLAVTAWSLWPVTRWDWLCLEASRSSDGRRTERLLEAANHSLGAPTSDRLQNALLLRRWRELVEKIRKNP